MAHEPLTQRELLDRREAAKKNLAAAHEKQHGLAKANDNLSLPEADDDDEPKAKAKAGAQAKAQDPAEDK